MYFQQGISLLNHNAKSNNTVLAYVLSYLGCSQVQCVQISGIDHRTVSNIRKSLRSGENIKDIRLQTSIPNLMIKATPCCPMLFSQLFSLYCFFHKTSPKNEMDLEALVMALCILEGLYASRKQTNPAYEDMEECLTFTHAYNLAKTMHNDYAHLDYGLDDDGDVKEDDYIILEYKKDYGFVVYSSKTYLDPPENYEGFYKLTPMSKILKRLKSQGCRKDDMDRKLSA